jgi:uncharacterized protein
MRKPFFAVLAAGLALAAGAASAQPYNLTIAGYSPGGLVSTVGAGLNASLAAAYPGSTLTYQTSSGGLANAVALSQKKVPLAFIAGTELDVALKGKPPIGKPIENLRILFHPYSPGSRFQATHVLFTKAWASQHGISSLADIGAKKPPMRIAVNRPGNLDGDVALALLAAHGITPDSIRGSGGQLVRAASQEITSLMLDRRLDGVVYGISYNHATIREMANGLELVMLPVREEAAKKVAEDLGAEACSFKAGEYAFLSQATASVCVGMSVVVRADMDAQLAYNITKGVFDNIDKYKAAHRLLEKEVSAQTMSQKGLAPFHPGAEKYLREKGLAK